MLDRIGVLYAVLCFSTWGLASLFWKSAPPIPPEAIAGYRVVGSLVVLILALAVTRASPRALLASIRARAPLVLLSALSIAVNWTIFIHAVASAQLVEASIGYLVSPLATMAAGLVFFAERFDRFQKAAAVLMISGVVVRAVTFGSVPWIALGLATSFVAYGTLRKKLAGCDPRALILAELLVLFVPAAAICVRSAGLSVAQASPTWVLAAGLVSLVPTYWLTRAARVLPLTTMGSLQFIYPMVQLAVAVAFFGERVPRAQAVSLGLIALGVALYCAWLARAAFSPRAGAENTTGSERPADPRPRAAA